ncbi:indolepyruvate oxidoreductase subunit beta [Nanoarchaeota archaeon]
MKNIILAGVGGQGILTLAGAIARAAISEGFDVKGSELHGLAMRFGSLNVHIRIGKDISSPLVSLSDADLIISQEPIETLRNIKYANKKTVILFDTKPQVPLTAYLEKKKYPSLDETNKILGKISKKVIPVHASDIVYEKTGSAIMANTYLLGRLAKEKILPIKKESYIKALKEIIKPKALKGNLEIFELAYK